MDTFAPEREKRPFICIPFFSTICQCYFFFKRELQLPFSIAYKKRNQLRLQFQLYASPLRNPEEQVDPLTKLFLDSPGPIETRFVVNKEKYVSDMT